MRKFYFAAALAVLLALPAGAAAPDYDKKVRVPMAPGVKWLYAKIIQRMVKPNLADAGGDPLLAADLGSESLMGASNYATALSNGRLFVEVSPWAELTVFRWPNPTYSDQLRYFTLKNGFVSLKSKPVRYGANAPSEDWARYGRPIEPCPRLGSEAWVHVGEFWLGSHFPVWKTTRRFAPEDGTVLTTELIADDVSMTVEDFIHPTMDLMVREYTVHGPADMFSYTSTFAPFIAKPGQYTDPDPMAAGGGAKYLEDEDVVIQFTPKGRSGRGANHLVEDAMSSEDIDKILPKGGVFIAWGFDQKSYGGHISKGGCFRGPNGGLTISSLLWDKPRGMLVKKLDGGGKVTVYIAIAETAQEAVGIVKQARAKGAKLKQEAIEHWTRVAGRIATPQASSAIEARVARRSILNLIQGQDREGGCIVASVSRQPAYNFDWPRDGAFFDLALDLAGFPERVDQHLDFYGRTQMDALRGLSPMRILNFQSPVYKPAGHWPSNMAADGTFGSVPKALPFELDETGLLTWDLWRHERVLPPDRAAEYAARMLPTLTASADALLDYVDFKQGWTKPAFEDDSFPPDATLHGVTSVLAGLAGACDAGPRWGIEPERFERWCEGARVLRAGVRARIDQPDIQEQAGWRGVAWSLWPAPIFDSFDEPAAAAFKASLADRIREKIDKVAPGFAYLGEEIFILALADREQGEYRDLLREGVKFLTGEVPFPGTDCYGEVTVWVEQGGEKLAQQRTSIPHLWNGVTAYLAVMAVYQPEVFDRMRPPPP